MTELGQSFREFKEYKQKIKSDNRFVNTHKAKLLANEYGFDIKHLNHGLQLRLQKENKIIDYYPSTNKVFIKTKRIHESLEEVLKEK